MIRTQSTMLIACALLVCAIGIVFGQTLGHDFVNWDDHEFVYNNPHITGGLSIDSILWALTDGPFHEWYPLAVWSHMLDCQLYGLWPGGHHLSSVLLRAAASLLLLLALVRLTGDFWPSAVVAMLFAVHPLHVESVAWVSERRDVLSALCFMLVLLAVALRLLKGGAAYGPRLDGQDEPGPVAALAIDPTVGPINDPLRVRIHTRLGVIEADKGRLDEAIDDYRQALEIAPKSSVTRNNLGLALQRQGDLEGAAAEYRYSVELEPTEAIYVFNLGNVLWRQGKLDEAVPCYQHALKLDPNLALARERLARLLAEKKEKDKLKSVAANTRRAITQQPDTAAVRFKLADALAGQGKLDEATQIYRQALPLDPRNAKAHNNLATILARQQRFDEAIEHYRQALTIQPVFSVAHYNLANLLATRGRITEAIAHYRRALEIDPAYNAARRNLDRLEAAQKKSP
jgi:tetratricopeptide (TPR) repeat protein